MKEPCCFLDDSTTYFPRLTENTFIIPSTLLSTTVRLIPNVRERKRMQWGRAGVSGLADQPKDKSLDEGFGNSEMNNNVRSTK